jgi:tight adherence protein C
MVDWIGLSVFLATSVVIVLAFVLLGRGNRRALARVRGLGEMPQPAEEGGALRARLALVGGALMGVNEARLGQLRRRFVRAGLYVPSAPSIFLGVQVLLCSAGLALGLALGLAKLLSTSMSLYAALVLAGLGLLAPGLWLDTRIARWQATLRRGLPDAMDLLVLCLEGGASLNAALAHVTEELRLAHRELGGEMELVQHEMLLGKTAGEAMQTFAQRCNLEEVRSLAGVLLQNERYGVSVAKALRVHADAMREQRQQRAEEMAQKAAVKILFPTLLFIFPAVFVVILGPAAVKIMAVFSRM